jgi:hypothetical protein
VSGRATDAAAGVAYDDLLNRMLAGHGERTSRAYFGGLAAFARFRGRTPAEATAELLGGDALDARLPRRV